jgi:hypothetical protein
MIHKKNNLGSKTREGQLWKSMIQRCSFSKLHPSYIPCEVSTDFKDFQVFAEWCNSQFNFNCKDESGYLLQLDKDLLVKGNKVYSSQFCTFIPREINMFLVKRNLSRGKFPVGVCYREKQNKWESNCNLGNGKQKYLGVFTTSDSAFIAYKRFKENLAKSLAYKYSDIITEYARDSLENYTVNIED